MKREQGKKVMVMSRRFFGLGGFAVWCLFVSLLLTACALEDDFMRALKGGPLIPMVYIESGSFIMGSPYEDPDAFTDETQHSVFLTKNFYIGKFPVTQKQYRDVTGNSPSHFQGDNRPVEMVSWFDAIEFCNTLSELEGRTPVYTIDGANVTWDISANGYRLPTEAEWEYSCRAGTNTVYNVPLPNGSDTINNDTGWYNDNSTNTNPVGQKPPNAWGLYDMHGNVWEWCWDWYNHEYYENSPQNDPAGPNTGTGRVLRGGSFSSPGKELRSAYRAFLSPSNDESTNIGFRVVRNAN